MSKKMDSWRLASTLGEFSDRCSMSKKIPTKGFLGQHFAPLGSSGAATRRCIFISESTMHTRELIVLFSVPQAPDPVRHKNENAENLSASLSTFSHYS